jgi:hypothetical protein
VGATLLGCDETGQEAEQFQPLLHTASALFHLLPRVINLAMLKVLFDEILDLWVFSSEVSTRSPDFDPKLLKIYRFEIDDVFEFQSVLQKLKINSLSFLL